MTGRLTLLLTSPRIASGLLTREAWQALDAADVILGVDGEPQLEALRDQAVVQWASDLIRAVLQDDIGGPAMVASSAAASR